MTDPILEEALARATDTKAALIGRGVLDGSGDLLVSRFGSGPFRLVADENTWQAAGATDALTGLLAPRSAFPHHGVESTFSSNSLVQGMLGLG